MTAAPVTYAPVAVGIEDAAALVGMSVDTIRRAIRSNSLVAHYPTKRPVILVDDLRSWVEAAPTEYRTT